MVVTSDLRAERGTPQRGTARPEAPHSHEDDQRQHCAYLPHARTSADKVRDEGPREGEAEHGERHHEVAHMAVWTANKTTG